MDYAQQMAIGLAEIEAFDAWRQAPSAATGDVALAGVHLRRLAQLQGDLLRVGVQLSIMCSVANWLVANARSTAPQRYFAAFDPRFSARSDTTMAQFEDNAYFFRSCSAGRRRVRGLHSRAP